MNDPSPPPLARYLRETDARFFEEQQDALERERDSQRAKENAEESNI